ncbi:MAG: hypothetical protein EoVTN8_1375 [Fluviibacter phosphoraccumulans EoVTN8]
MAQNESKGWSPYIAGALVGVLAIISVYLTTVLLGKSMYLDASTTFVRAAGMLIGSFDPTYVADNAYYVKEKVIIDWQFMMIVGDFYWRIHCLQNGWQLPTGSGSTRMGSMLRRFRHKTCHCGHLGRHCHDDRCTHGKWMPKWPWPERHDTNVSELLRCARLLLRRRCLGSQYHLSEKIIMGIDLTLGLATGIAFSLYSDCWLMNYYIIFT